jgi:hypothetical protein
MMAVVEAPRELIEGVAELQFSPKANARLQELMDRNTEGALTQSERDALEAMVELSETMSLLRAQALRVLGRSPK